LWGFFIKFVKRDIMYSFQNDYQFINNSPIVEPVTVAEAKQYCRVNNDVEDDLFAELITQSREAIEMATNLSLIPRQVDVWFNNEAGSFPLPFGPITYFMSLYNAQNNLIPQGQFLIIGGPYPKVAAPLWANMKASYMAGYDCLPKELKIAMLDQINYGYENRGMDVNDMGICEKTWRVCQRWTKTSPIL
jgi:hypothetical protein